MYKYQRWYDELMDRAGRRVIPACYTERHHIVPKSLGGPDDPSNLVTLTYREHFIAHWLLTKFKTGGELRKMQRSLFAMTLSASGRPTAAGWQFEAAKRAVRDLELDPEAERQFYERWRTLRRGREDQRAALKLLHRRERQAAAQANIGLLLGADKLDRGEVRQLTKSFMAANRKAPKAKLLKRARWRRVKKAYSL